MKNTTFRKKALLSSVAMLLVALVALGSATFAWFTSNPNANASGLSLKTTASTGLVIRTETDSTWSHEAKLANNMETVNLDPVSQVQNGTEGQTPSVFYTVDAKEAKSFEKADKTPTTTTSGYYKENIYCRLSDGSDTTAAATKKVYITGVNATVATGATMGGCIRVAIAKGDTLLGTWSLTTDGNGVLTPDAGSFNPALATYSTSLKVDTGLSGLSATGTDLSKYITVYVYLDGQHTDCYSDKVGTVNAEEIISSVKVDLTLAD